MKNKLLITTALVALTCGHNAYAENLPADATNLTSGNYVVERSDTQLSHSGDINLSGTASLDVKTQAIVEEEADEVDVSKTLNVSGNVSLADNASLSVINSDATDETEKPFMFVDGKYIQTGGELTLKQENGAGWRSTLNAKETDISSGTIKLDTGEIFIYGNADDGSQFNISGGTFEMNDSNISTYPAMSEEKNAQNGAAMSISGGTFKLNESSIGRENSGNLDISGGEFTLENNSAIFHDGAAGDINISGGTFSLKDSSIVRGGNYQKEDGASASGDINISGGTLNLNNPDDKYKQAKSKGWGIFGSNVAMSSVGKVNITDGEVNLSQTSINGWEGINVSGGALNLSSQKENMCATLWSKGDIILSGGVINTKDAAINTFYNEGEGEEKVDGKGNIIISGATINLADDTNLNIGAKGDIRLDAGIINIGKDASLEISDKYLEKEGKFDVHNFGSLQISQAGVINLGGTLSGNLTGNGTINFISGGGEISGNVDMKSGGVMNVGLNRAVVEGDVNFDSGSTLKLEIADSGNGSLQAANIVGQEGSTLALNITKKMAIGDTLENVALLKGNVDNHFTNEISNTRYKVTSADGKNFDITYENTASDVVTDAGGSANNAKTAEAWDSVNSLPTASEGAKAVASILGDLSQNATTPAGQKAYIDALTAVAPDAAPAVQQTSAETANQVFGAVGTRLSGGSISTGGEGMSSGDVFFERGTAWVQGLVNKSKLDDTSKAKGFDADSSGVAFGFEKFVTDDVKAGVGYAYSKTDIDGFMRSTDVDTHTAILYGEYRPNNWYVNAIATYGWSDYSEKKNVAGVTVKADYDVEAFGLQSMTGYDMNISGIGLTPEAGLRYVHIKQDAYKDSADQRVSANESDILTGLIGAKVSKNFELFNDVAIKPEVRVAATYDLMNDDVNSVVTLANGSVYSVKGKSLDRFGMEAGVGVTAEVGDKVEVSLGYEGKFREDYQDHTGLLNAKYKF